MAIIPELKRHRQKDCKFQVSLGYISRTLSQKIKKGRKGREEGEEVKRKQKYQVLK
jgi:hypothetical protein